MTAKTYEQMDAAEIRAELDEARDLALRLADELVAAVDSGNTIWAAGIAMAAKPSLERVKRLRRMLRLGVAH